MDYDDNDAKEQNLHLTGEGSSKVSPILHPYALPKFDFDDNLQGHLRFDSLVENEVFLGITSQEDNQWIEEYSRGTSAIQFSSSAAESRRKDVWSEATSLESVEMLLKSVGQEEKVLEETTVEEETFACDKPGKLTNDMDPNLKQCDETDDYVNTNDAPIPDEFHENFVGSKVSSYCEQSHAASNPQSQETPVSGGKLDSVVIGDKYSLSAGEKNVDKICNDVNQEPVNLANESFVNDSQDLSVSKIECENAGSSPNVIANVEECQENPQEVARRCIENVSGPSNNFYNDEPEDINKNKETIMDNPINSGTAIEACTYSSEKLSVVSHVASLVNPLVEGSIPVDDKPTCSPMANCDMQKTEGCHSHVCSAEHSLGSKSEISASLISTEIDQELNDNMQAEFLASSPNDGCVKREAIEDAMTQSDVPGSPKSNLGSPSSLSHVQNHSFEDAENGVVSDGQQVVSGASMVSLGNNQFESSEISASLISAKIDQELNDNIPSELLATFSNGGCVMREAIEDATTQSDVPDSPKSNMGSLSSPSHVLNHSSEEAKNGVLSDDQFELSEGGDINNVGKTTIAVGSLAEMSSEDISNKAESAGNHGLKVHTGDSEDEDQSLPVKISSLVPMGDEIQSSEPDAIFMDQDVTFTAIEACTYSSEKLSVVSNVVSLDNPLVEGCNTHVSSAKHSVGRRSEIFDSLISSKIDQELNDNIHAELLETSPNGGCVKRETIEDAITHSDIPEKSNMGSLTSLSYVLNHSFEEAKSGVLSDDQFELSEGSDINNVGKTSTTAAGSLAEQPAEDISNKDESAGNHAPKVHTGDSEDEDQSLPAEDISNKDESVANHVPEVHTPDSNAEHQSSRGKLSSLVQVGDEIQSSEPDAISMDQDVTFNERVDARSPLDFRDIDMDVVGALDSHKNDEPSSSAEGCKGVMEPTQGSEPNMAALTDAVAAVEPSKISPPDTLDDVHLPSETDATAEIVTEDQPISSTPGASLQDGNEEKEVGFYSEENSRKGTQEGDCMVDCSMDGQLPVVESSRKGTQEGDCMADCSVDGQLPVAESSQKGTQEGDCMADCSVDGQLPVAESFRKGTREGNCMADCSVDGQLPVAESSRKGTHEDDCMVDFPVDGQLPVVGSSRIGTHEDDCMVDCPVDGQLPVVERDAVSDGAEKVVHRPDGYCDPPVGNCNASPSEQIAEDNPGDLKCSKSLETISLPCESLAERGNDAVAGGMTRDGVESLNLAVNMSDEQQASVDVAGPSERDTNHVVQNEVASTSLEKPQMFSFSDTKSIELSQTASDKHDAPKDTRYVNALLLDASNDRKEIQSGSSSNATKEEKSFTFDVSRSAGPGQTGIQNSSSSKNTKVLDPNKLHEDSLVGQQTPSSSAIEVGSNGNSERKPKRKSAGKETAKKGNNLKETTPRRRSVRVEKSPVLLNPPAIGELKPKESVECSNPKPGDIPPIPTSNLPDLNNPSSMFQQSFTDTQQVQLRAQILVYGSLISGMAPEESHMIAAFGQSDDGKRVWEATWHACLERVRGRKSQVNNPDTPMQSRPDVGKRDPAEGIKVGSTQNKVLSPLTPKPSKMGISSNVVSPMIPISSPLWNISTPFDRLQSSVMPRNALLDYRPPLSPLLPYQTPQMQSFTGHNPSWLSQSPFPGQWVASSPVTAFGARLSSLPITDAVKLATVKESGAVIPVDHAAVPAVSSGLSSLSHKKKALVSSGQPSSDSKSRKRKKVTASGVVNEMSVSSQAQVASVCTPVAHLSLAPQTEGFNQITSLAQNQTNTGTESAVLLTPVSVSSKSNPGSSFPAISLRLSDQNVEKIVTREEIVSKIEESKRQAADAAVHAADAVSHCQDVWSQLEKQKSSGLVSDDEAKLASSAVSIAAAASVAKVAALAAKIASNVAEQARLMADEVFLSSKTENYDQISMITNANIDPNFDKATPSSILKNANINDHSTSIISAARDAARRRIEAASAATKHAENLDAIVKAAELAAEAVSQAGKIVTMGNPLPLRELVEAGPEGYWKTKQNLEAAASDKDIQNSKNGLLLQEGSRDVAKIQIVLDGISGSTTNYENDKDTERPREGSDMSKTVAVFPEPEFGSVHISDVDQNMPQSTSGTREENGIKEGCFVEVYKDDNKNKGAWFAANVLNLKDGKAFVCYTEIQSDEGSGKLKEWVPLEAEGTEAPRIRIAHPMTKMQFEGTRKRSRKAFTDHAWCSGDKVDVWVQDGWREAVVLETNKIDGTSINVQFPGQGETSIIKSWHVRPTLIWKDGKWIESPVSKGYHSAEGDMPKEKRLKVGKSVVEGQENDKSSNNVDLIESEKHQQSKILPLSGQGTSFDVGKSSKDDNKLENTRKAIRGNLQKERPRVVFGVPKPAEKQKFMDVSKHYVAEGSNKNNNPLNDSAKLPTSLIPQPPGLNGSRNNSKNDAKEKQVAESKSKVLKTRKPPIPSVRTLVQKDKSKSSKPTSRDAVMSNNTTVKDSVDENVSPPKSNDLIEDPSASSLLSDTSKGKLTSKTISQRLNKGKVAAGGSKGTKVEVKEKPTSESEPRRSNRRIQPTSRLLEGLQSSLSVSKTPTSSHGSQRSHTKIASKGNG